MGHVSLLEGIIVKLKDEEIFERISKYVEQVRISEGIFPTVRRVEAALGIPKSTVHRYLKDMEADPKYTAKADKFAFDDDTAAWLSNRSRADLRHMRKRISTCMSVCRPPCSGKG